MSNSYTNSSAPIKPTATPEDVIQAAGVDVYQIKRLTPSIKLISQQPSFKAFKSSMAPLCKQFMSYYGKYEWDRKSLDHWFGVSDYSPKDAAASCKQVLSK